MATYSIRNLTFTYPGQDHAALTDVSLDVHTGEMVAVCGQSGSGKSTLLRNLKPILAPHGDRKGHIYFYGTPVDKLDQHIQAARIGYVLQNPDAQIVTDKVWHELAFGLESLGLDTKTIRLRVAEMASFFGIQTWFHKSVSDLSGGQKQLLNLASVMAMQPDVLILDEPTSQLDPIAAGDFLETVSRINRELGTTVIITEHRLEEVLPRADRAVVLDHGRLIADDTPANVGAILAEENHPMFMAMPTPLQVYATVYNDGIGQGLECPVDVRGGRNWLTELLHGMELSRTSLPADEEKIPMDPATGRVKSPVIEIKDAWFRYNKEDNDVIRDLNMQVYPGEIFCIVGGNGTGKTTTINLISGINKAYRGYVKVKGEKLSGRKHPAVGVLPQNPQSIFVEKSVREDLAEINGASDEKITQVAELVEISHLLDMHPYDLSGGEQQRAAMAKVLLLDPEILVLDEPTKGLDNSFKFKLAGILNNLKAQGTTIVMVSHDVEFCGRYGDRCAMFFDGKIITTNAPRTFFSGNSFYTTAANRMSRHIFENAVNVDDLVELIRDNFGRSMADGEASDADEAADDDDPGDGGGGFAAEDSAMPEEADRFETDETDIDDEDEEKYARGFERIVDAIVLVLSAATIYFGFFAFETRHYMAVCIILVLLALVPFFASFENSRPKARELVIMAVLIATAVVGRAAFFMIPNFKPILAIVMISGVALGKRSGFLVGAMSAFVSNFLFGQGPWTPFQMIAMAICGYLAGLVFHKYYSSMGTDQASTHRKKVWPLAAFGAVMVFFLYGAIVDVWTVLSMAPVPTMATIVTVYGAALYFNLIHAGATVIFLAILAKPMLGKLNRVKLKYGL